MQGYIRRLENPPVSSREAFAALDAAKAELGHEPYTLLEAQGINKPGALRVTTYYAITLDRAVVAVHCVGPDEGHATPVRYVLWFDPAEATAFANAITKNARIVQQYENGKRGIANGSTQH